MDENEPSDIIIKHNESTTTTAETTNTPNPPRTQWRPKLSTSTIPPAFRSSMRNLNTNGSSTTSATSLAAVSQPFKASIRAVKNVITTSNSQHQDNADPSHPSHLEGQQLDTPSTKSTDDTTDTPNPGVTANPPPRRFPKRSPMNVPPAFRASIRNIAPSNDNSQDPHTLASTNQANIPTARRFTPKPITNVPPAFRASMRNLQADATNNFGDNQANTFNNPSAQPRFTKVSSVIKSSMTTMKNMVVSSEDMQPAPNKDEISSAYAQQHAVPTEQQSTFMTGSKPGNDSSATARETTTSHNHSNILANSFKSSSDALGKVPTAFRTTMRKMHNKISSSGSETKTSKQSQEQKAIPSNGITKGPLALRASMVAMKNMMTSHVDKKEEDDNVEVEIDFCQKETHRLNSQNSRPKRSSTLADTFLQKVTPVQKTITKLPIMRVVKSVKERWPPTTATVSKPSKVVQAPSHLGHVARVTTTVFDNGQTSNFQQKQKPATQISSMKKKNSFGGQGKRASSKADPFLSRDEGKILTTCDLEDEQATESFATYDDDTTLSSTDMSDLRPSYKVMYSGPGALRRGREWEDGVIDSSFPTLPRPRPYGKREDASPQKTSSSLSAPNRNRFESETMNESLPGVPGNDPLSGERNRRRFESEAMTESLPGVPGNDRRFDDINRASDHSLPGVPVNDRRFDNDTPSRAPHRPGRQKSIVIPAVWQTLISTGDDVASSERKWRIKRVWEENNTVVDDSEPDYVVSESCLEEALTSLLSDETHETTTDTGDFLTNAESSTNSSMGVSSPNSKQWKVQKVWDRHGAVMAVEDEESLDGQDLFEVFSSDQHCAHDSLVFQDSVGDFDSSTEVCNEESPSFQESKGPSHWSDMFEDPSEGADSYSDDDESLFSLELGLLDPDGLEQELMAIEKEINDVLWEGGDEKETSGKVLELKGQLRAVLQRMEAAHLHRESNSQHLRSTIDAKDNGDISPLSPKRAIPREFGSTSEAEEVGTSTFLTDEASGKGPTDELEFEKQDEHVMANEHTELGNIVPTTETLDVDSSATAPLESPCPTILGDATSNLPVVEDQDSTLQRASQRTSKSASPGKADPRYLEAVQGNEPEMDDTSHLQESGIFHDSFSSSTGEDEFPRDKMLIRRKLRKTEKIMEKILEKDGEGAKSKKSFQSLDRKRLQYLKELDEDDLAEESSAPLGMETGTIRMNMKKGTDEVSSSARDRELLKRKIRKVDKALHQLVKKHGVDALEKNSYKKLLDKRSQYLNELGKDEVDGVDTTDELLDPSVSGEQVGEEDSVEGSECPTPTEAQTSEVSSKAGRSRFGFNLPNPMRNQVKTDFRLRKYDVFGEWATPFKGSKEDVESKKTDIVSDEAVKKEAKAVEKVQLKLHDVKQWDNEEQSEPEPPEVKPKPKKAGRSRFGFNLQNPIREPEPPRYRFKNYDVMGQWSSPFDR